MTLYGTKDADFGLGLAVAYTTTSPALDCVTVSRLAGVTTQRTRTVFLPSVRKGETYRINLPLDAHAAGQCGWKPAAVFLDVVSVASRREPPKPGRSLFLFGYAPGTLHHLGVLCRRTAYQRSSSAEQAAYLCRTEPAVIPPPGPGRHAVEMNFSLQQCNSVIPRPSPRP